MLEESQSFTYKNTLDPFFFFPDTVFPPSSPSVQTRHPTPHHCRPAPLPASAVASLPPPPFLLPLPTHFSLFSLPPTHYRHCACVAAGHQLRRPSLAPSPSFKTLRRHGQHMHSDPRPPLYMYGCRPLSRPPAGCLSLPPSPSTPYPFHDDLPYRLDPPTSLTQHSLALAGALVGRSSHRRELSYMCSYHQASLLVILHPSQQHHTRA